MFCSALPACEKLTYFFLKYCHIPYGTANTMAAGRWREVSTDTSDGRCYLLFITMFIKYDVVPILHDNWIVDVVTN